MKPHRLDHDRISAMRKKLVDHLTRNLVHTLRYEGTLVLDKGEQIIREYMHHVAHKAVDQDRRFWRRRGGRGGAR